MFGEVIKRAFNALIVGLAALSFFLVPIGRKTAAQHLVSIFTTKPAREAGRAVSSAAHAVAADVETELKRLRAAPSSSASPEESRAKPSP